MNDVIAVQPLPGSSPPAASSAAAEIGAKNLFFAQHPATTSPSRCIKLEQHDHPCFQPGKSKLGENDDDIDDTETVEPARPAVPMVCPVASSNETSTATSDDIEIDGVVANQTRLSHVRSDCTEHPFVQLPVDIELPGNHVFIPPWTTKGAEGNVAFCDFCYCYVCDKPAKECKRWISTEYPAPHHNHCHADENSVAPIWRILRQYHKVDATSGMLARMEASAIMEAATLASTMKYDKPRRLPYDIHIPVSPTDTRVLPYLDSLLWKCRKCGWHTARGGGDPRRRSPWCSVCGRIASNESFIKDDCTPTACSSSNATWKPYQPKPTDVFMGSKTIPFRLKAHDPRKSSYRWKIQEGSSPEWTFDEAEMEEDLFRHRLGKHPSLQTILETIQLFRDDKVPDPDRVKSNPAESGDDDDDDDNLEDEEQKEYSFDEDEDDDDYYSFYGYEYGQETTFSSKYGFTNAVLMDQNGVVFFQELWKIGLFGEAPAPKLNILMPEDGIVAGNITASWNKDERCGEFTVRLYIRQLERACRGLFGLLGTWFDVFPFSLSELAGPLTATHVAPATFRDPPLPPCKIRRSDVNKLLAPAKEEMTHAVNSFNTTIEASQSKMPLQSSFGSRSRLGGGCTSETTFTGMLRRYASETIPETLAHTGHRETTMVSWFARAVGVAAYHRTIHNSFDGLNFVFRPPTFETFVRNDDIPLASENLAQECNKLVRETKSINAILVHLENLGHDEAPFVEGLNVELLPFQRQTLQWALEREKSPGGLQSFLWAKLPFVEDEKCPNLYYSPLLEYITTRKPKLVRGGIIAEEMGLGKTVISLALILQNPAPLLPQSGSKSEVLGNGSHSSDCMGWDRDWCRKAGASPLQGSILSRGTLVVCHVSLVGQWIEEAKRRLKDPGQVYAYHGQSRKRDAMVLAKNSIIVTTYATLAKDSTYHAIKSGNADYCPPCEQVRWWRIICDESHALKQESSQTRAVMSLVGDHKWAVSGTPWNTSLMDVKNQLKFVGLEYIDPIFSRIRETAVEHVTPGRRRGGRSTPLFGEFMFLMRAAMIRHSQNQQYRGTSTTLMSLPPKTERTIVVDFTAEEALEYTKIATDAIDFYVAFKEKHWKKMSHHYLKLIQRLIPLRVACSGGRIPLIDDDEDDVGSELDQEDLFHDDNESVRPKKKKASKVQVFSDFTFKSKVSVLMEELKKIRDTEPDSKSLVFSQYVSSLRCLQEELPKHGFQYRTLSGDMSLRQRAEALHAFQNDPPTTIFLLSMRAGAVGINLTQANRVFLLEPALNPSLEAQAVGRVHRLGQTRPVEIVRLLMNDSIDTKISQLVKRKYSVSHAAQIDAAEPPRRNVIDANAPIVGSVRTDKAAIMSDEFDYLFGVTLSLNGEHVVLGTATPGNMNDGANDGDVNTRALDAIPTMI